MAFLSSAAAIAAGGVVEVTRFLPDGFVRDGSVSYAAEIQAAIDAAAREGQALEFPAMVYAADEVGWELRSRTTVRLGNAEFRLGEACARDGAVFHGKDVSDVTVTGGAIIGRNDVWQDGVNIRGIHLTGRCAGIRISGLRCRDLSSNGIGIFGGEDGHARDVELLREFPGDLGHGRNDLAAGPQGEIYSIHGDAVLAPDVPILDRTSPLRESRRGKPQREAYLVRTDSNGKNWELLCTGLRNPYGVAVHPNGDLFTYDADNEYDMGTPWYRPTRIVQLVSGADYGYRAANGSWPPRYPDHPHNGLPTIDVGRGSPTAAMFGTHLKFPEPYRQALFVLDWAYGRVLAVHLAPRGAGYRAALELFLQGTPLNVTDVAAGPDGAMWLITGGRKTQSALYRVIANKADAPGDPSRHEQQAAAFAQHQRTLRQKLERYHALEDATANTAAAAKVIDEMWPYLADADPLIRHAARIAIEKQPRAAWMERAISGGSKSAPPQITASLEGWMAAMQTGDAKVAEALLHRLLEMAVTDLSLDQQFALASFYRDCLSHAPAAIANQRHAVLSQLNQLWPNLDQAGLHVGSHGDNAELRRRLALLLGDIAEAEDENSGVVDRLATTLLVSPAQEDRLQGLLALRNQRHGWTAGHRRLYFNTLREAQRFVSGQGMPTFLDKLRTDAVATLSEDERSALAKWISPSQTPANEPLPDPRPHVQKWTLDDLAAFVGEEPLPGDPTRGALIFRDALCSRCHRAGLTGPAVGPDLTYLARRFTRADMLDSILKPSRVVAENYRNVQIVTESGKAYVGRLLTDGDFRSEKLRLSVDPLHPGKFVELDKKEIVEAEMMESSPMPEGLLDSFTREEIADLLAFLERGSSSQTAETP